MRDSCAARRSWRWATTQKAIDEYAQFVRLWT